jgi:hypothetical protein
MFTLRSEKYENIQEKPVMIVSGSEQYKSNRNE